MSVKIDPEGPRRSKKDPVRLRELRQTSKAAFAASSFSSWLTLMLYAIILGKCSYLLQILPPKNCFADKETIIKYTIWK